jgi:antitoxin component YwqK of YwqJK toxin-antitoxin module
MQRVIWILLLCALLPVNALAWYETIVDTVESRWPNGQLKEQYITMFYGGNERTWKDGQYRSWYQNGQLEYDGAYDNDLKAHTWTKWDSLGWKVEQVSYVAGKKHGEEITWHPNLQRHKSFWYLNGELHGLCTLHKPSWGYHNERALGWEEMLFYVEGALLATIKHSDSERTDESARTYYNAGNDIWVEKGNGHREFYVGRQVDGKKHGKWILWTARGYKQRVDFYNNGKLLEF